jgi:subtilase family serine protease
VCTDPDGELETALDVEWSHVVAPGATISLIVAALSLTSDLFGSWSYYLKHSLGNEISNSWGGSGSCGANSMLYTAMTDHVTVLASAGDSGAWGKGTCASNTSLADCQYLLTVGGTTFNVKSTGAYINESVWSGSGSGRGNDGWPAGKEWDVPAGIGSFVAMPLANTLGSSSGAQGGKILLFFHLH